MRKILTLPDPPGEASPRVIRPVLKTVPPQPVFPMPVSARISLLKTKRPFAGPGPGVTWALTIGGRGSGPAGM